MLLASYPFARAPDLVLLLLDPLNDVADNGGAVLAGRPGRPYFVPAAGDSLREIPWVYHDPFDDPRRHPFPLNVRTWLSLHSIAYRGGRDLWRLVDGTAAGRRVPPALAPDPATIPLEYGAFMVRPTDPRWEIAWTITERLIRLVAQAAHARGADLRIVLIPHYATVQPELTPSFVAAQPADFDLTRAHARVRSIARARGVPLLDFTPGVPPLSRRGPRAPGALLHARQALHAAWPLPDRGPHRSMAGPFDRRRGAHRVPPRARRILAGC